MNPKLVEVRQKLNTARQLRIKIFEEAGDGLVFDNVKCLGEIENGKHHEVVSAKLKDLKTEIEGLEAKETELADIEQSKADSARDAKRNGTGEPAIPLLPGDRKTEDDPVAQLKGTDIGAYVRIFAKAKGHHGTMVDIAKEWDYKAVHKALSASTVSGGGALIQGQVSNEVIELLRASSIVRLFSPRTVSMDSGTLTIPRQTVGATAGWIGENENLPYSEPQTGDLILTAKKLAGLVAVSNDLLRRASTSADQFVRDDLVKVLSLTSDLAFIRATGSAAQPKGIRYWASASTLIPMSGSDDLAGITATLGLMLQSILDNNVAGARLGWMMEPRTWRRLITIRDSNGNYAFKPEMDGGRLYGHPFRVTSQIPRNLGGGGNETELYLVDFDEVILGETTGVMLDASGEAAYWDGSAVQAAFSRDQTVIRAIQEVDLALRHDVSAVIGTGITWGA